LAAVLPKEALIVVDHFPKISIEGKNMQHALMTSLVTLALLHANSSHAQQTKAVSEKPTTATKKTSSQENNRTATTRNTANNRKVNPAFQNPEKPDPNLPNVLIIGDSISIGYMVPLREELSGVANVYRPQTNCGPSSTGLENLDAWLGDRHWSLIQINHGLHDLKYMGPQGQNLADPNSEASHQQIPPDQYAKNLNALAERLKKTGAKIIWCETTPVPEGAAGRVVGDSKKYNEIAKRVMASHEINTNGLFDYASKNVPTREANVHYTPENSKKLAAFVASSIKKQLE
jgi:acyl-CoA thioesterase-1